MKSSYHGKATTAGIVSQLIFLFFLIENLAQGEMSVDIPYAA